MHTVNTGPAEALPPELPFTPESPIYPFAIQNPAAAMLIPAIATEAVMLDPIAAAVRAHSNFLQVPYSRIYHTGASALSLTLGDNIEALAKARDLWNMHAGIQGEYGGVSYSANDGPAQAWVLMSLDHAVSEANRRWGKRPMTYKERDAVWRHDIRPFGLFFGTPDDALPKTLGDVFDYRHELVYGEKLLQTHVSRDLVQEIFSFHSWKAPLPYARFAQAITKASIDPIMLEQASVTFTDRERRLSAGFDRFMQRTYARLPAGWLGKTVTAYTRLSSPSGAHRILPQASSATLQV